MLTQVFHRCYNKKESSNKQVTVMAAAVGFALAEICNEARTLVARGLVNRIQPIADLARFYSASEWAGVCQELGLNEYCLHEIGRAHV